MKQRSSNLIIFSNFSKVTPFLASLGLLCLLIGCQSERGPSASAKDSAKKVVSSAVSWAQGDCIDTPLSPYVYQISAVEGDQVYLYKLGEMGKKVVIKSISNLRSGKEPFEKIPCP